MNFRSLYRPHPFAWAVLVASICGPLQAEESPESEEASPETVQALPSLVIHGQSLDELGYDDVFFQDIANAYRGKEDIERYRGTSAADLFRGLNGVYSGDARNANALDPNIRGIQGEGRIPLSIDGTQQAMSVWLGPAGVANRNYLDPYMVSSVMVEKGPSMTQGIKSGIGGGVRIRTLMPEDVIRPGNRWGLEIKTETASNATDVDTSSFSLFGKDYRDIPGAVIDSYNGVAFDQSSLPGSKSGADKTGRTPDFNLEDKAFRVAAATQQEHFDFLAAYSYRSRGNYFSGKNGSSDYRTDHWRDLVGDGEGTDANSNLTPYLAELYWPKHEVPNTASENVSTLLKAGLMLPDNQELRFNYMHNEMEFGESVQWMVQWAMRDGSDILDNNGPQSLQVQWPHSKVDQKSYGVRYSWQPDHTPWVNLQAGLWETRNDSRRHQNGGWPWGVLGVDHGDGNRVHDRAWDAYVRCHVRNDEWAGCDGVPDTPPERAEGDHSIIPAAQIVSSHKRWGADLSNHFVINPDLSVLVTGDFQSEELAQRDAFGIRTHELNMGARTMGPRSGSRQEYTLALNSEWMATDWLKLTAGARYSRYWSFDDGREKVRKNRGGWGIPGSQHRVVTHRALPYLQLLDANDLRLTEAYESRQAQYQAGQISYEERSEIEARYAARVQELNVTAADQTRELDGLRYWQANAHVPYLNENHEGFVKNDPFLNGEIDLTETVENPQGHTGQYAKYRVEDSGNGGNVTQTVPVADRWAPVKKKKGDGWAPMLSATASTSPNARVYARYSEAIRFPSVYEDTQAVNVYGSTLGGSNRVEPERSRNWELGYVHDLTSYFPSMNHADIKFNYFNNDIEDFIDRDNNFNIVQFDEKSFSGLEFQSRWDSGRYYADLAVTYRLDQKVCDADYAATYDPYHHRAMETCVTAGFPNTNARISLQPEYSVDLSVGSRLMNGKLQLGGRMAYHSEAENDQEAAWKKQGRDWMELTKPFYWNEIMVFDAFLSYQVNRQFQVDFGVNNVTDEYYLDPLARTTLPAPGRTFKLGVTFKADP
ncbi:TonB-dependent receptor [Marinobacter daepoensis]|uniref:TonB-dependent receptor n=1 Tax=Marinobacter daepoensis TaxID=262077 RepID=A0ABS3BE92_9GAMM|nr:TonB-dependent receptor [Marinobacter daepoensis]MBN7769979.1 TonB-dependent receptor [Marinobacter daepoensis]MBY6080367.1 TonB-dependent receptor [Marinobacter daepoensis]